MAAGSVSLGGDQRSGGRRPRMSGRRRAERKLAAWMLAPSLLIIALVAAYPIGYAIYLSLREYSIRTPGLSRWAGLGNYSEAITSPDFLSALGTTFLFTAISVGLELVLGLGMAIVMHEALRGKGLVRTVVLVPWATLTVVTAFIWRTVFEPELGIVNAVLGTDVVWLGQEGYALAVMIFADVWKTAPFMALLLLAGLQTISGDLYEAAKVDGASVWQRFRSITLPLLGPAITVALIFRTLDALRIFDLPQVLTGGAFGTTTLSLLAYEELRVNRIIGLGAALSVLTFVVVMAVSFLYIRLVGGNIRELTKDDS